MKASLAISTPVFPELLFVSTLMGSIGSIVGPPVTSMRLSFNLFCDNLRSTRKIMSSMLAIFARPSSNFGSITSTPFSLNFIMFSWNRGLLYIVSCIAGTIMMGISEPNAVVANAVTVVSEIPHAILLSVFAVHGAIRNKSANPSIPKNSTCSIFPISFVMTSCPVAYSSV